ncbi:MAG: pyridoxamine 5'-phosphate oxidase family protein [Candidatus Thiodiazotropha sp.]|jgi:heme iron utilization protein
MNDKASHDDLIRAIQKLLSESFHGLLSTHSVKFPGYPFGSLLPICLDSKGNPHILISHLAQHTQNLDANPHCSLMLYETGQEDVQQLARLTCLAKAEPIHSPSVAERYFRYYPESRRYHKELNFIFYRLTIEQFYFIGGFGSARWFDVSRITPPTPLSAADESELLYQLNTHKQAPLKHYLSQQGVSTTAASIEAIGANLLGVDVRLDHHLQHIHFQQPLSDVRDFIQQLDQA